jgi:hypothetical protein
MSTNTFIFGITTIAGLVWFGLSALAMAGGLVA